MSFKPNHRFVAGLDIGVASCLILAALLMLVPGLASSWEASTYDLRMRWRGAGPATDKLVMIGRDAESDARFGVGIWDRAMFAKVIGALHRAGATAVALDFHFGDESPAERGGGASDRALADAVSSAGNVLVPLPVSFEHDAGSAPTVHLPLKDSLAHIVPTFDSVIVQALLHASRVAGPMPGLLSSARGGGHIGAISDPDGVYRRVPTFVNAGGVALPSMGVALAAAYLHVKPDAMQLIPGDSLVFPHATLPDGSQRTLSIPVDRQGNVLIDYAGRWTDGPFPYLSFADVWDAINEGREAELREQVAGKAVLIVHAALGSDKRQTPLELTAPGGFILANIFSTVLTGSALRPLPDWGIWMLVAVLGTAGSWSMLACTLWNGIAVAAGLGLAYLALAHVSFLLCGLVLPIVLPIAGLVLATGGGLVWSHRLNTGRIHELESGLLALHRELAGRQQLLVQHETRVEQLEDDLESARTEATEGQAQTAQLRDMMESLQRNLRQAQEEAAEARQAVTSLQARLDEARAAEVSPGKLSSLDERELQMECARQGILTRDPGLLRCWKDLRKAARSLTPILILGEPGTGKELFAQAAHRLSDRSTGPFVPVNMAAVPADLFESQLFGHKRGSFTGSVSDHDGYFLQANKGTIFLDEIGDLPMVQQAKLLRVLQEGVVTRVGDRNPMKIDVRVVSATNKNLLQGIAEGWFREDLYYRVHGIELRLPPLRERQADLPELAKSFIDRTAAQEGRSKIMLSQGALDRLKAWPWKGNVRELKRCLENAVILADGATIMEEDLRLTGPAAGEAGGLAPAGPAVALSEGDNDPKKSDTVLLRLLREHSFDLQATAATLGWDRSTVMQRLKGMCFQALVQQKGDERAAASRLAGDPGLTRLMEVKLKEYVEHLHKVVATFPSQEAALAGCRKRFKNLPERYHEALAELVRVKYRTA
ncbi:MAG: sigma 54-interacting transcriptional regulator [Nitrospira sp.]|jgi:DNA-binding NtrC family response regulator/CHASE2 domain-containing sensor protein|nr:sigma 54-interacting transcriptional regulator [Nitrospira sp.]